MVNVLSGADPEVGAVLTTSPDVDMVTFTGSTPTGRRIMAAASETLKKVFLELGGKSAAIVLDDADFNTAALFSAFAMVTHAGQGCALTSRLLVPRKHHDEIVELVKNNFGLVRYGDPTDPEHLHGSADQREAARQGRRAWSSAPSRPGATLVTGGEKVDPGYFYTPTLLTDVDPDSEIAQEEVFGPVLVVIAYDDDDDAVRIANNSIYGLSGAVFGSEDRALAVARRIRTGTFSINGGNYFSPDSPFGGYKQSGIGREMGSAGFEEFLESKTFATVVCDEQAARRHPRPRGRHVRLRPVGGRGAGRVGRRRHQGRARGHRRPAARAAADRPAAGRGRPQPQHRARQPRQAQHRAGHVGARGQGSAATNSPGAPTCS